jgi:hypothetical protein
VKGHETEKQRMKTIELIPDPKIVHALSGQLSWTHLRQIIYLDDPLKRDFYAEMCRIENWSTRTLEKKIGSMLFERTALSRKPAKLAELELKQLREEDKLALEKSGIRVSSYWTEVLPKAELERKLHEAVLRARARLQAKHTKADPMVYKNPPPLPSKAEPA